VTYKQKNSAEKYSVALTFIPFSKKCLVQKQAPYKAMAATKRKSKTKPPDDAVLAQALKHKPALREALLNWFARAQRPLPWRANTDAYRVWVSEIMLQQTQVERVKDYFSAFVLRFPTVKDLAAAPLADVLSTWRGLGYYSRAKNLHAAALTVVEVHGGAFPRSRDALLQLKGFGPYTAGAVASIAFGEPAPIVDGNVARVFARLFAMDADPQSKAHVATLWAIAAILVEGEQPGDFNQSLMELGATLCTPRNPSCLLCPVRTSCAAQQQGITHLLPRPKKQTTRKAMHVAVAVCRQGGRLLLARRAESGLFAGLWEMPSATVSLATSGSAQLRQLLGPNARVAGAFAVVERTLTHRDLMLHLHLVNLKQKPTSLRGYLECAWVAPHQLADLGISSAMQAAIARTSAF
jgi:A/G-specific adenine glycosylase